MDTIRKECQFCGAVQYLKGEPIAILEHRPVSLFINQMVEYCDPSSYVYMDYPLSSGCLTETAFLELPDRAFLTQDLNGDGFEVAGEDTRLVQWLELPAKVKGNIWYVFRNRAHFDSFNSKKKCNHDDYPLKPTGIDPFHLVSTESCAANGRFF